MVSAAILTASKVRDGLYLACRAGIAAYSPHGLYSKASMTLDLYAHVVIDRTADEWPASVVKPFLQES